MVLSETKSSVRMLLLISVMIGIQDVSTSFEVTQMLGKYRVNRLKCISLPNISNRLRYAQCNKISAV